MRNVNHTFKMSAHVLENERTQFNEFIRNSVWKAKEEELIMLLLDSCRLGFHFNELYFLQKFYEDKLYPAPKPYFSDLVSQHLKLINYDRWAELYWKKQLETLSAAEENELGALEKENLKIIEEVYSALSSDKEIQAQLEKIRENEWAKVVEGDKR